MEINPAVYNVYALFVFTNTQYIFEWMGALTHFRLYFYLLILFIYLFIIIIFQK